MSFVVKVIARNKVREFSYAMACHHPTQRLFVTNQRDNSVSVVNLDKMEETAVIYSGDYPEGIDFDPVSGLIYVANWFDGDVAVIDPDILKVNHRIATDAGSRAFGKFITAHNLGQEEYLNCRLRADSIQIQYRRPPAWRRTDCRLRADSVQIQCTHPAPKTFVIVDCGQTRFRYNGQHTYNQIRPL